MRVLLAYLLLTSMIGTAVEWGDRVEGELRWGETLQLGDYSLEAADFTPEDKSPRMVMLNLRKGGELIATRPLKSGESFTIDDEVMVVAGDVMMIDYLLDGSAEPKASVSLLLRAVPDLQIRVVSKEDSYRGGDRAKVEVEVENVGMTEAEDVKLEVNFDPEIAGERFSISNLAPGDVWDEDLSTRKVDPLEVNFRVPSVAGPQVVRVEARARYLDTEGGVHESVGGTSFDLFGPLRVFKYADDEIRFGEESYVHLSVSNGGDRSLVVALTDSAGRDFKTDSSLEWKMTIPPGESRTASYTVDAKKPGDGQTLPPAEATYSVDGTIYKVKSSSPVVDVIGPLVEVAKGASSARVRPGETVTVTVTAKNVGNRRTKASLKETVPAWATLVAGETEINPLLLPGEEAAIVYTISCRDPGSYEIPATAVCYRDDRGTACTLESSQLRIAVEEEEEEAPTDDGGMGAAPEEAPIPSGQVEGTAYKGDISRAGGRDEVARDPRIFWALPALILIIFIAFDRYL